VVGSSLEVCSTVLAYLLGSDEVAEWCNIADEMFLYCVCCFYGAISKLLVILQRNSMQCNATQRNSMPLGSPLIPRANSQASNVQNSSTPHLFKIPLYVLCTSCN